MIPYGRQSISEADIKAVREVLESDFLTQGPCVPRFEQAIMSHVASGCAVAVNSATSALHLSCLALGLRAGDWLWTSPNTFVASANCALYCGARVDFVDIDPKTYNMCVDRLEAKLVDAENTGTLPKIVVPVHFAGQSCDMQRIKALGERYGFKIIEDASHAIGGQYRGEPIGSCRYSDITVFSFHPVKIITSAEGGMATTNSVELRDKLMRLRSHGITRDPDSMTRQPDGDWYYQQIDLGFNYRMTDMQAALGASQAKRLGEFVRMRHELARRYDKLLQRLPVVTPYQEQHTESSYHLYPILVEPDSTNKTKAQIFSDLRQAGIGVNVHYIPVHLQPYYLSLGFQSGDFEQSEEYYRRAISIPLFHGMTFEQQDVVVEQLEKALL